MTKEYTQFYINGSWVDPTEKKTIEVINPANEEVCAHISLGNEADVNKAVEAASAAFRTFSVTTKNERLDILDSVIDTYKKYHNDLADAVTEEMGAPSKLSVQAQAGAGIGHIIEAAKVIKTLRFNTKCTLVGLSVLRIAV